MRNISWCPCLKVRVNFHPEENYAAHFTVCASSGSQAAVGLFRWIGRSPRLINDRMCDCVCVVDNAAVQSDIMFSLDTSVHSHKL